jgi:hypothetical protein
MHVGMQVCILIRADAFNLSRTPRKWRIWEGSLTSEKKGQRNVWQGNKTKVMSLIPLPIIPLPMTLLDGPSTQRGATRMTVLVLNGCNNLDASALIF